jgi:beta-1,2-mannobiose phosphorylase / 1,2-beta-oligomannan phosphorylase
MAIFQRYSKNPILVPNKDNWWESKAVFNCSVSYDGNNVHMLYRAIGEYDYYISRIGYASSTDGFQFNRRDNIAICQTEDYEKNGMEDPRITQIEDKIFITYVVISDYVKNHPKIYSALTVTKDYYNFAKLGIITSNFDNNKDVIFFPEKFNLGYNSSKNGSYLKLHRPSNSSESNSNFQSIKPSIWLSISDSEFTLTESMLLLRPEQDWEELKIGAGPSPIKTKDGWLLIYHGVNNDKIYRVGAVILDLKDPRKVIARTKTPILEPIEKYERVGDVNNVVFPTGIVVMDRKLLLYYGGADKVCCVASANIDELIEFIMKDTIVD